MNMSQDHMSQVGVIFLDMGLGPSPDLLVRWLNENHATVGYRRLGQLFNMLGELEGVKKKMFSSIAENKVNPKLHGHAAGLREKINRVLKSYEVFPQFGPFEKNGWPAVWMPAIVGSKNAWRKAERTGRMRNAINETNAVLTLVGLARMSSLNRVRHCANDSACQRWFFAKPMHKKFCSTECQQKSFRSTEAFQRYRRDWMRQQRTREKTWNVRGT
jgi:hypothetical protein